MGCESEAPKTVLAFEGLCPGEKRASKEGNKLGERAGTARVAFLCGVLAPGGIHDLDPSSST